VSFGGQVARQLDNHPSVDLRSRGRLAALVTGCPEVRRLMDAELLERSHREPENAPRSRTSTSAV
jgi:hypothetical protein